MLRAALVALESEEETVGEADCSWIIRSFVRLGALQ